MREVFVAQLNVKLLHNKDTRNGLEIIFLTDLLKRPLNRPLSDFSNICIVSFISITEHYSSNLSNSVRQEFLFLRDFFL